MIVLGLPSWDWGGGWLCRRFCAVCRYWPPSGGNKATRFMNRTNTSSNFRSSFWQFICDGKSRSKTGCVVETNVQIQLEVPWEAVGEWSLETTLQHFWYQTVLFTVQETFLEMIDDLGKNSLLDRVAQCVLPIQVTTAYWPNRVRSYMGNT